MFGSLGGFPVRRGTADREALKICEQALAAGEPWPPKISVVP